jgi:hypothetical protein
MIEIVSVYSSFTMTRTSSVGGIVAKRMDSTHTVEIPNGYSAVKRMIGEIYSKGGFDRDQNRFWLNWSRIAYDGFMTAMDKVGEADIDRMPLEYIMCHAFGHAWTGDWDHEELGKDTFAVGNRCNRCGTLTLRYRELITGRAVGSPKYDYTACQEKYILDGAREKLTRADWCAIHAYLINVLDVLGDMHLRFVR